MSIEDGKQAMPQNQPHRDIKGVEEGLIHEAQHFVRSQIHELLQRAVNEPDKKHFVLEQIASHGRKYFPRKEHLLDAALAKIDATPYDTDGQFEENVVREMTNTIVTFVASSGFSTEETRQHFRRIQQEQDNSITTLDKDGVIYCTRFEDKIDLHITKGLKIHTLQEAFSALAQIVQSDESIRAIEMTSWVVAKYRNAMRKYHFPVTEILDQKVLADIRADLPAEMRDKPIAKVSFTRNEFFETVTKNGWTN